MLRAVFLVASAVVFSCQTTQAGTGPQSTALVEPGEVPEQMRPQWEALLTAQAADPASTAVEQAANALLEEQPPPRVRASALLAKAERQYLLGADAEAIRLCDEGLALLPRSEGSSEGTREEAELETSLHRRLALALARGGEPERALELLTRLEGWGSIERLELRGARAVALDRKGESEAALAAFVAWRELLSDEDPAAGYASERIEALVGLLPRDVIEVLAEAAEGPLAADCLRATLGVDPGDAVPRWVRDCRRLPARIGILLPRSGKLAVLADAQFAAAVAAVSVLGRQRPVSFMWRDSGSSADGAREGANQLVADGAEVIVGPIGTSNVKAAYGAVGDGRFVIPGEGSGAVRGIAPTLEQRVEALLAHARANGASKVFLLAPDSGYGRRIQKARSIRDGIESNYLKIINYKSSETTFEPVLRGALEGLRGGGAILVADALPRTELIARQLRRADLRVAGGQIDSEGKEVMVMAMGEGWSPSGIDTTHASLDGVILAPVAHPDADSRAFEDEYQRQQGEAPNDQALLVWRALEAAWRGAAPTLDPQASLVQVRRGQLVALSTP